NSILISSKQSIGCFSIFVLSQTQLWSFLCSFSIPFSIYPPTFREEGKITSNDIWQRFGDRIYQETKEVINIERIELNHSAHSTQRLRQHIVFVPIFR
ncbi:MAG: hypothetical protein IJK23_12540, partial [Clostridia bacterium]|nr:hypothetical protein [Clostridia bacterium]